MGARKDEGGKRKDEEEWLPKRIDEVLVFDAVRMIGRQSLARSGDQFRAEAACFGEVALFVAQETEFVEHLEGRRMAFARRIAKARQSAFIEPRRAGGIAFVT